MSTPIKAISRVALLLMSLSISVNTSAQAEPGFSNNGPGLIGSVQLAISAAGERLVSVGERGSVYILDTNQDQWLSIETPVEVTLTDVFFLDEYHGWAVGHSGVLISTTDGGITWQQILDGDTAAQIELTAASEVQGEDSESRVARAERLVEEGADKPFLSVKFWDDRRGMVIGAYGLIYQTEDGGVSWQSLKGQMDNTDERHLYNISRLNDKGALIVGEEGRVYLRTVWGGDFKRIESPYEGSLFGAVVNDREIIVYGLRGNTFRTLDRGLNWTKIDLPPISITDGLVTGDGHVLLANEYGQLFKYSEPSESVIPIEVEGQLPINSIVEVNENKVVVSGMRGINTYTRLKEIVK